MDVEFNGQVWEWRGPAPYYFVTVTEDGCATIDDAKALLTYGWGMIPVSVTLGATTWVTSLWPKDGRTSFRSSLPCVEPSTSRWTTSWPFDSR